MDKSLKPRIYKPSEKDFSHNGLGVLRDATRADVREQANGVYELEVEYPLKSRFKSYFENGYQIKAKPNDQEEYHIFEIKRTYEDTLGNNILIYAQSRTYKLGNRQVQHVEIDSKTGADAMRAITAGMDLPSDIELYSDIQTVSSTLFEARNVLNCIAGEQGSLLQFWGGEIKREPFKLSLLRRRGRDKVGTVRYGKDLQGLKINFDWQSIVTRCLPYADLQNSDDGQTKRIYGDPVNSDLISNYPDIYARHVQFTEEQGVKDKASLDRVAKNYFKSTNAGVDKPKVSIELEIEKLTDSEEAKEFARLRNYGLFDTFAVYHKLYDIYVEAKITEVTYDSLNEKTKKVRAGDAQIAFYKQQNNELQETIKTLTKKGYMSEFVDYVTNLINGVEGGSVLQYPKNKPHTTYYMDTDSRETAKDVIAINNQGIGFSRTGWLGPFVNAWGIDGTLNADFIRAGKIRANIFETSFNAVGDQLMLVSGALRAMNGALKIMELTKKGLEFWSGDKAIGTMGTAGEPFPDLQDQDGPVTMDGEAVMITTNDEGQYIAISAQTGRGIILGRSNGIYIIDPSIRIIGDVTLSGDINVVGDIKIRGEKVFPGQGSGGGGTPGGGGEWNGQYPSEVTTQAEQFAWQAWITLISLGYSKAAAAGILGNIRGEVGPTMNPDTDQVGGPAYGAIQFDGSAYPLIGEPTNNGREYFQRLHNASGVGGDYREMSVQMKVVDWAMTNGQWIGVVSPTSVSGFKNVTSPETGAYAFEKNFERPAADHPERQGWAREWYNKFVNLSIEQGDSWILPIARPVSVTSEFGWRQSPLGGGQEFHNGIDLVNGNSSTPILAAEAGIVRISGSYPAWYGNYVVIEHANGMFTGYGHLASLAVQEGQQVAKGQRLGIIGTTGPSTGIHLHFQFFRNGPWPQQNDFINPRDMMQF